MWYQRVIEYQDEVLLDPRHHSANTPQSPKKRRREETERDDELAHFRRVRLNSRDSAPPHLPSPTLSHALTADLPSGVESQRSRSETTSSEWSSMENRLKEDLARWLSGIAEYRYKGQRVFNPRQGISYNMTEYQLASEVVYSADYRSRPIIRICIRSGVGSCILYSGLRALLVLFCQGVCPPQNWPWGRPLTVTPKPVLPLKVSSPLNMYLGCDYYYLGF
jgi:hypothetical protein